MKMPPIDALTLLYGRAICLTRLQAMRKNAKSIKVIIDKLMVLVA